MVNKAIKKWNMLGLLKIKMTMTSGLRKHGVNNIEKFSNLAVKESSSRKT
jgi:hypothetical protein